MEFYAEQLTDVVYNLYKNSVISLPSNYLNKFYKIFQNETQPNAKFILSILAENLKISFEKKIPICQDTGIPVIFLELGCGFKIIGDPRKAIDLGIKRACDEGLIRASVCHPLSRKNTLTNTPAIIHYSIFQGDYIKITLIPKGCGSENMSALSMLSPSSGERGIIDFVKTTVKNAGPNPCPPLYLGLGIGGTMEEAAYLSKKALILDTESNESLQSIHYEINLLEQKILDEVNRLSIGPMGLGGDFTCTGIKIITSPCHIASLPIALNIQCHAARCQSATFINNHWQFSDFSNSQELIKFNLSSHLLPNKFKKIDLNKDLNGFKHLRPGEWVLLSGELITARDQTLQRIFTDIDIGIKFPFDFNNTTIYFTGPTPSIGNSIIGSCGPTTSYRMRPYIQRLKDMGVLALIGKGYSPVDCPGLVYLSTIGGAGAYLSEKIVSCETLALGELGPEAILRLKIRDFPAIVIHSYDGSDLYVN